MVLFFRQIVTAGCISLITLLSADFAKPLYAAQTYACDVDGDGVLGLAEAINILQDLGGFFAGGQYESLECGSPTAEITNPGTLSQDAKRYLLCQLNAVRSRTALGQSPASGGGTHPVATNMQRLMWDEDLATVASNFAAQCNYTHNSSRTSEYRALLTDPPAELYVGENIYASSVDPSVFSYIWSGDNYGIAGAETSWSSESEFWTHDTTYGSSECDTGEVCGHYTQNVWAKTTKVGCGYHNCEEGLVGASGFHTFVVCNFAQGGNSGSKSVYLSGTHITDVCSEEINPSDGCENGLITPDDYSSGVAYECDIDGDDIRGMEELLEALRVISGYLSQ